MVHIKKKNFKNKTTQINKLIVKEIRFGVTQEVGRKNWMKTVKRYEFPGIRQISIRHVLIYHMYNLINILNIAVCYI